jgi:signal transduction histidine kinase
MVVNALQHTPAGGRVCVALERVGRRARLSVSDTGSGIAAEHLPSIFERFYRADPSRQQATGGSGLGLAIIKSIVEAHGGRVSVVSAPGQGTKFTIALPVGG